MLSSWLSSLKCLLSSSNSLRVISKAWLRQIWWTIRSNFCKTTKNWSIVLLKSMLIGCRTSYKKQWKTVLRAWQTIYKLELNRKLTNVWIPLPLKLGSNFTRSRVKQLIHCQLIILLQLLVVNRQRRISKTNVSIIKVLWMLLTSSKVKREKISWPLKDRRFENRASRREVRVVQSLQPVQALILYKLRNLIKETKPRKLSYQKHSRSISVNKLMRKILSKKELCRLI